MWSGIDRSIGENMYRFSVKIIEYLRCSQNSTKMNFQWLVVTMLKTEYYVKNFTSVFV